MAQVAKDSEVREWIDDYLDYLFAEWEAIPEVAAEWDEWQDHEQLDFVVEWPIREDRLRELQQWAEQGLLAPQQQARYERLLALVARQRPTLEKLLRD
ncbi:MAG TPA: hypothetical protein VK066_15705 [Chloroflexota bacterium]|nr:hypothetical protein [Chloroflexota bacterium]